MQKIGQSHKGLPASLKISPVGGQPITSVDRNEDLSSKTLSTRPYRDGYHRVLNKYQNWAGKFR